ncbi:MAG: hypothetical protein K2N38_10330 [Oscillospiraceae bacterium]|nr:hypothetical protein [Oscillospiraceae bacterium]
MARVDVMLRRIAGGSFKRMLAQIDLVHGETGKNRALIFADMTWCILRYGVGYRDYRVFGFSEIHGSDRLTFLTMDKNLALCGRLNDRCYTWQFEDKAAFNDRFSEFIGREFLDLRVADRAALERFCEGRRSVFAKRVNDFGGSGIARVRLSPRTDYAKMYEKLRVSGQLLVEEELGQHEKMKLLSPSSVNTLRIVTICHGGRAEVLYAVVRMGVGGACVDNTCSGGIYAPVTENGVIEKPAFRDSTGEYFDAHPTTGTIVVGFEIPMFAEALALCKRAAGVVPQVGYVGWDVAITPDKPVLIEGNALPNYTLCQNFRYTEDRTGILPRINKILDE